MRKTLNEVYRLSQKATEGAGAPAGLDLEAAQNTVWLLARGLPALTGLTAALEMDPIQACRFDDDALARERLDATGKAGALIAPTLVDLLVARADGGQAWLAVTALSAPLYLLPAAARYVGDGCCFRFELNSSRGVGFVLTVDQDGASILGSVGADISGLTDDTGFDLVASYAPGTDNAWPAPAPHFTVLASSDTLAKAEARSLAEGVEIESGLWQRLQTFAARVLVPASEASRQRGAGAAASDNE